MQSETIGALAAALAKAQGEIKPAPMDRSAKIYSNSEYKYATLTSLWESARAALAKNGLSVVQTTDFDAHSDTVLITTLMHSSGEWIGGVYPVRAADNKPQTLGSALTYARRYAFGALVGLTSDDDDDGNSAQNGAQNGGAQHTNRPAAASATNGATTGKQNANGSAAKGNGVGTDATTKRFHAAGNALYGQNWDAKRHEIVKAATKGRTSSSKDLTPAELAHLADRMEERLQEEIAAINVQDAPEMEA